MLNTGSNSTFKLTYLEEVSTTAFKDVSPIKVSVSKARFSGRSICLSPKREVYLAFQNFSFSRTKLPSRKEKFSFSRAGISLRPARLKLTSSPIGLSLSPVALSLSSVGLSLSPEGLSLSPVGLSLSPEGLSSSPVGLSLSPRGLSCSPERLSSSRVGLNSSLEGLQSFCLRDRGRLGNEGQPILLKIGTQSSYVDLCNMPKF